MQASREWVPPSGTLGRILAETRERVASIEEGRGRAVDLATIPERMRQTPLPSFPEALRREHVAVIAEVKRRSPSKGGLNPALNAGEQAARFERGGAAAASILTEPRHFGGSIDDLRDAAGATRFPLLRKDFHIAPRQLVEAHEAGASAALLIARAMPAGDLRMMLRAATALPIDCIVEVRTEAELETALAAGARMIGVNARDLETLELDERVPARLIPTIPPGVIAIWESGIATRGDVERAAAAGADAVLVGSALSLARNPEDLLATLATVPGTRRG